MDTRITSIQDDTVVAQTDAAPSSQYTYADLFSYFDEVVAPTIESEGTIKNLRSTLNRFLAYLDLTAAAPIGTEMGQFFSRQMDTYLGALKSKGTAESTISRLKSEMRRWKDVYDEFLTVRMAPSFDGVGEAIEYYFNIAKAKSPNQKTFTKRRCAILAGLGDTYITGATRLGLKTAHLSAADGLAKLEQILGAPPTTFTKFATFDYEKIGAGNHGANNGKTEWSRKIQRLRKEPYRLKELPEQLFAEIKAYHHFKTTVSPELERNKPWRVSPISQFSLSDAKLALYCYDGKTYAESGTKFVEMCCSFFGALAAKGYDKERFSLAYLAEPSLLREYVEFMQERHEDAITETTMGPIDAAGSLLHSEFGWLTQQPEFALRLLKPMPDQVSDPEWRMACATRRQKIIKLNKDLRKKLRKGRAPMDPIREILQRQHPITALLEMAENMEAYLEAEGPLLRRWSRVTLERDLFLLRVLTVQPLRAKMLREMTWRPDNEGHLYKRANGCWAIKFEVWEFKNEDGAKNDEPYDIGLPPALWPHVEHYLTHVRPHFVDGAGVVFSPRPLDANPSNRKTNSLAASFTMRTRQFIPGCAGFGPHAVRHIVATEYIRNNPEGYQVAAALLHDTVATVMLAYAHVNAEDGHNHFHDYLEGVIAKHSGAQ